MNADAASLDQRRFLEAFARHLALAVERARWAAQAGMATLKTRTEELRSSLLSTVSHDLRTPLASITGAATALLDHAAPLPEAEREELLGTICGEAERLERLVGNLLDMTRLEAGGLQPRREWVPLEELVLLDLGLPDGDGLVLARKLREWSKVPIIVLSARDREDDKVVALDAGADDYLTKPFGVNELLARMRVALRHAQKSPDQPLLELGALTLDLAKRLVTVNGKSAPHPHRVPAARLAGAKRRQGAHPPTDSE